MMVGDAAHPVMPFFGQGGCQALETLRPLARWWAISASGAVERLGPGGAAGLRGHPPAARAISRLQTEVRLFGDVWHFEGMAERDARRAVPPDSTGRLHLHRSAVPLPGFGGEATAEGWLAENPIPWPPPPRR